LVSGIIILRDAKKKREGQVPRSTVNLAYFLKQTTKKEEI
jgi:hypothetical protein